MPQPIRTKKANVDEILSKRGDLVEPGTSIVKAARAPASWDKDSRSARFCMNAQAVDRYGDIVMTAGIDTNQFEQNPVALLFHNSRSWPIGSWSNLEKVLKGRPPRLEGDLNLLPEGGPVKEVDECAWMIENGGIRACSIGFVPDWDEAEMILDEDGKWSGGIRWNQVALVEASCVPVPASPQSLIKDAGGNMRLARELIEDILDNWARNKAGMLVPRAEYEAEAADVLGSKTTVVIEHGSDVDPETKDDVAAEDEMHDGEKSGDDACGGAEKSVSDEIKAFLDMAKPGDTLRLFNSEDAASGIVAVARNGGIEATIEFALSEADAVTAAVDARRKELSDKPAETITVKLDADTAELEEKVGGILKHFRETLAKILRAKPEEEIERREPNLDPPPMEPPSAEAIAAVKAQAAAVLGQLREAGRI